MWLVLNVLFRAMIGLRDFFNISIYFFFNNDSIRNLFLIREKEKTEKKNSKLFNNDKYQNLVE